MIHWARREAVRLRDLIRVGPHLARSVRQQDQQIVSDIGGHRSPLGFPVTGRRGLRQTSLRKDNVSLLMILARLRRVQNCNPDLRVRHRGKGKHLKRQ